MINTIKALVILCLFTTVYTQSKDFLGFEPNPGLFPLEGQKIFDPNPDVWNQNLGRYREIFRAGVGYSLKRRDVTFPMFIPGEIRLIEDQSDFFSRYSNVDEMLTSIYLNQEKTGAMMYSHREGGDVLYRDFFNENTHSAVHLSHRSYLQATIGNSLDPDFEGALRMLPDNYDEQPYSEFCDIWGCSIVTESSFGGSIESQLSIRSCSSTPDMDLRQALEIATSTGVFPDMSFGRFTSTKRINIVGGNPEISTIPERVSTFDDNPVLVSGSLVPLHEYLTKIPDIPNYLIVNLEKAYKKDLYETKQILQKMKDQGRQKALEDLSTRKIYHVIANNEVVSRECQVIRGSCLHPPSGHYCRTDACVQVGETKVGVGETSFASHDLIFFQYLMDISRLSDGSLRSTFKIKAYVTIIEVLHQSQPFRDGCVNYQQKRGDDQIITLSVCSNCQPTIQHSGPNEYFDCVCPTF